MTDDRGPDRSGMDTARVALHSSAYSTLMEEARAAMPAETVGLLFGSSRRSYDGQSRITVSEVTPVRLAGRDGTLDRAVNDPKHLLERAAAHGQSLELVGWFYADPGTSNFPPRISIEEVQRSLPDSANLFLVVNPSTDQGAFYLWNGRQYVPHIGFDEVLPGPELAKENATPLMEWSDTVRGVAAWFGGLLADLPSSAVSSEQEADSQEVEQARAATVDGEEEESAPFPSPGLYSTQRGDQDGPPSSHAPIYVEVITEEPVEYVAPDMPATTGELTPPAEEDDAQTINTETQPYPILSEESDLIGVDEIDSSGVGDDADGDDGEWPPSGGSRGGGKATGPLDPEEVDWSGEQTPPEAKREGHVTRELETTGDTEANPGHSFSAAQSPHPFQARTRATLVPVARSPIHPVMKQRGWREILHALGGLAIVAVIALFVLAGLMAQQENANRLAPPVTAKSSPIQDNAQAGGNAGLLPAVTETAIVTATVTSTLPGINK